MESFLLQKKPRVFLKEERKMIQSEIEDILSIPDNWTFSKNEEGVPIYGFQSHSFNNLKTLTEIHKVIDILNERIKADVYGNLISNFILNSSEKSYTMYSRINQVRKGYYKNRTYIRYLAQVIRDVITYSKQQIDSQENMGIELLVDGQKVAYTDQNYYLIKDMIKNLETLAVSLWNNVFINMDSYFEALKNLHLNLEINEKQKISELIQIGANLIGFQSSVLDDQLYKLRQLQQLLRNSPKYQHINQVYAEQLQDSNIITKIEEPQQEQKQIQENKKQVDNNDASIQTDINENSLSQKSQERVLKFGMILPTCILLFGLFNQFQNKMLFNIVQNDN